MNARTTKDRILSPAPLAKLGYPCLAPFMRGDCIKPSPGFVPAAANPRIPTSICD